MIRVRLWHATVIGAVVGLLVGMTLEIGRQHRFEQAQQRATEEFESQRVSPPLMMDLLRPHAIPVATCVLFAALGSFVFVIRSQPK